MAAVPLYFGVAANWVSGAVVDRLFRKGWGRLSRVVPAASGFLIGAVAICGAAQARTPWASVLAIAIATFGVDLTLDRKSTRLNSSHLGISYAVFCLKKKKKKST